MDLDQMKSNIDQMRKEDLEASKRYYASLPDEVVVPEPVDIYKRDADARYEESKKKRPNGSSAIVKAVVKSVIDGDGVPGAGLASARKRAEDDSDSMVERGERGRAEIIKKQYMEERFLPAVETVIRYSSPDELLNCKDALDALDKYAMGVGATNGYTASYVRQAYGDLLGKDLNGDTDRSDPYVKERVCTIRMLADRDDIRSAVGLAKQLKGQIDKGLHIATDDDYDLIGRVANF